MAIAAPTIRKPCPLGALPSAEGQVLTFCGHCERDVVDLSALSAEAAARVLTESGGHLCVRYALAPDTQTVVHRPLGRIALGAVTLALGVGLGGVVLATFALADLAPSAPVVGGGDAGVADGGADAAPCHKPEILPDPRTPPRETIMLGGI